MWWPSGPWRSAADPPPELLAVEQRLVAAATGRAGEHTAVVSHQAVRAALQAHPSAGHDQQGMVGDLCQGGAGVVVVVGKAGTGKTFALGIARHAWQLDGYRPLACAPTGIATVSLEAEGFEAVAACPPGAGVAYVGMAEVAYQRGEFDTALRQVSEGIALCRQFADAVRGAPLPLATGLATLAWIRQARATRAALWRRWRRPSGWRRGLA